MRTSLEGRSLVVLIGSDRSVLIRMSLINSSLEGRRLIVRIGRLVSICPKIEFNSQIWGEWGVTYGGNGYIYEEPAVPLPKNRIKF